MDIKSECWFVIKTINLNIFFFSECFGKDKRLFIWKIGIHKVQDKMAGF